MSEAKPIPPIPPLPHVTRPRPSSPPPLVAEDGAEGFEQAVLPAYPASVLGQPDSSVPKRGLQSGSIPSGSQPGQAAGNGTSGSSAIPTEEDILEALRDVVDPELGINVVDLGLVYGVTVSPDGVASVDMTLTSAGCPLTDMIETQSMAALEGIAKNLYINWVWMPPWGPDKITDDGRAQLRAIGFNV